MLRKYVYQRLEFVTTAVHASTIHFSTIIANCSNISHSPFLPRLFTFTHKQNINVFKMLSVKCEEIWSFDIREFSVKANLETVNWIYVAYSQVL